MERQKLKPSEMDQLRDVAGIGIRDDTPDGLIELAEKAKAAQGRISLSGLSLHVLVTVALLWDLQQQPADEKAPEPEPKKTKKKMAAPA